MTSDYQPGVCASLYIYCFSNRVLFLWIAANTFPSPHSMLRTNIG